MAGVDFYEGRHPPRMAAFTGYHDRRSVVLTPYLNESSLLDDVQEIEVRQKSGNEIVLVVGFEKWQVGKQD